MSHLLVFILIFFFFSPSSLSRVCVSVCVRDFVCTWAVIQWSFKSQCQQITLSLQVSVCVLQTLRVISHNRMKPCNELAESDLLQVDSLMTWSLKVSLFFSTGASKMYCLKYPTNISTEISIKQTCINTRTVWIYNKMLRCSISVPCWTLPRHAHCWQNAW